MIKRTLILVLLSTVAAGCSTPQTRVEYRDREVLVPDIRIEACVRDTIRSECGKEINTYRDLAECYIILQSRVESINNIIKECNKNNY